MNQSPNTITHHAAAEHDRMFCYLWYELSSPEECKFGERWVPAGSDPLREVHARIRQSVGVRKDLIADGSIQLSAYWDVTQYAAQYCADRVKPHGRVDDFIRRQIGYRKPLSAEVHTLSATVMAERVNTLLARAGQPLPLAALSQNQHDAAVNVIEAIQGGNNTIVAELCARFGKTIWSGALIRETQPDIAIIATYVLTSIASFRKDLSAYQQFSTFDLIDSTDPDYLEQIAQSRSAGRQPVVFLSMVSGSRRGERIDSLFSLSGNRLLIIDEADFGVHKQNQSLPLIAARKPNDTVGLMTGTRGERAAGHWDVDHYLSVTYPELLLEKHSARSGFTAQPSQLQHFGVDPGRHALYVDVEFYQMSLASVVEHARRADPELFRQAGDLLPSWSKFAANPTRARGFFTWMLEAIFLGKHGDDSLNLDFQTGRSASEGRRVAMMFLPGSTTNKNLAECVPLAEQALPGYRIIPVYGAEMTNATAEQSVREAIEQNPDKHILIISAGMAQRSFSIPEITELFLAYDGGDNGATIQKMSRTLTPGVAGKRGRIVSLSFDPNRDDKFDAVLLETAQNFAKNRGITDLREALGAVLKTVDIFDCQEDGAVRLDINRYLAAALARNSIDRVIGNIAPVHELSPEQLQALASGNIAVWRAAQEESVQRGKTRQPRVSASSRAGSNHRVNQADLIRAREMIVTIAQNTDIIRAWGGNTMEESFALLDAAGSVAHDEIQEYFGCDYELVRELILTGFINRGLLDLKFS